MRFSAIAETKRNQSLNLIHSRTSCAFDVKGAHSVRTDLAIRGSPAPSPPNQVITSHIGQLDQSGSGEWLNGCGRLAFVNLFLLLPQT